MKKVLVGGVFSVIHPGHEFFLRKAKSLGDYLVVVLASDRTALESKGTLVKGAEERRRELGKLGIADKIIIGRYGGHFDVVRDEKPDIIALGYDQEIGKDFERWIEKRGPGCRIVRIREKYGDYSSSRILKQDRTKRGTSPPAIKKK